MKLKEYISPEFQWLMVELIDNALEGSDPPAGGGGDDYEPDVDEGSGEGDMNEGNEDFDWGDWNW